MRGRFIREDYDAPISEEKVSADRLEFRRSISGLESRIKDWSSRVDNGIILGRLIRNVSLSATTQQGGFLAKTGLTGKATWSVKDNAAAASDTPLITVGTQSGFLSGRLGSDITVGATSTITASNIAAFFNGKAAVQAVSSGDYVVFYSQEYAAPFGTMIFSDQPNSQGFTPKDGVASTTWVDNVIKFSVPDTYKKFSIGTYLRVGRALKPGGTEFPEAPPVLRPGRMKVVGIDSVNNEIEVDLLIPGIKGGDGLYAESDNAVPVLSPPTSGKYNFLVSRNDSPSRVWVSSVSPRIKSNTLFLRTDINCTVDLWVW